ncbi:SDR family oxidoreductase [Arenicella chitinivorans]|nr:SDR family oxidoreductase [Arenicella chitinivorans]
MQHTALITGTNRGIGLSLTKHYLKNGWNVIAACRQPSTELADSGATVVSGIDVTNPESLHKLTTTLASTKIDLLINNAGILRDEALGQLNFDTIEAQFAVNTLGPLRITERLLNNFNEHAKIAMITSRMGSIADNTSGGRYGYRMSKAALNIAAVSLAQDLKSRGIAVGIIHPGLVGTDMIGGYGDVTPDQAAANIVQRLDSLDLDNSGTFWHANGEILPW